MVIIIKKSYNRGSRKEGGNSMIKYWITGTLLVFLLLLFTSPGEVNEVPTEKPPIDEQERENLQLATFALG